MSFNGIRENKILAKISESTVIRVYHDCEGGIPGWVLRYFHTYVGSGHFFRFKILIFNIFGGFKKNLYFLGMKILLIFLGDNHKIGQYLVVIIFAFRVFS